MTINTNKNIINLDGENFTVTGADGKVKDLSVGDVLVVEVNKAEGVPLRMSWQLMTIFSKDNHDFTLNDEQKKTVIEILEKAVKRPYSDRFNLTIYGRLIDIIENKE